jgi:hypothetical protein
MKETKFSIGDAVVFRAFNGDSVSATIIGVTPEAVCVAYPVGLHRVIGHLVPKMERVTVKRADYGRITAFPKDSKFLVLETL